MDYIVALGTHQPLTEEQFCQRVGISTDELNSKYKNIRFFNHQHDNYEQLTSLTTVSSDEIFQIKSNVTIKENCDIEIVLTINEQVSDENHTRMFQIIDGITTDFGERITIENCIKGESKEYIWTIKQIHNNTKDGIFTFNTDVAFSIIKPKP